MADTIFIIVFFGILFAYIVFAMIRIPFLHRDIREDLKKKDTIYELSEINKNVKCDKVIGKLVRKTIDKERSRSRYRRRLNSLPYEGLPRSHFWKYYLTFETFKGYKSFTVTKKEYNKYQKGTYGYIYFQKSRFSHFEVHTRENLHIDDLIKKQHTN